MKIIIYSAYLHLMRNWWSAFNCYKMLSLQWKEEKTQFLSIRILASLLSLGMFVSTTFKYRLVSSRITSDVTNITQLIRNKLYLIVLQLRSWMLTKHPWNHAIGISSKNLMGRKSCLFGIHTPGKDSFDYTNS